MESTLFAANQNDDLRAKRAEMQHRMELTALREVFDMADIDGSGGLDMQEWLGVAALPRVKKVLEKLQLPSDEPEVLFELFTPAKEVNPAEVSGETLLTVKDFISGALKVRGPPTGLDMRGMTVGVNGISNKLGDLERLLELAEMKIVERGGQSFPAVLGGGESWGPLSLTESGTKLDLSAFLSRNPGTASSGGGGGGGGGGC